MAGLFAVRQPKNDSRRNPAQRAGGEFLIEVLKAKTQIRRVACRLLYVYIAPVKQ
jgi:hypothetical protein